jgi:hypothetical protein
MKWVQAGSRARQVSSLTVPHGNRVFPAVALGARIAGFVTYEMDPPPV